MVESKEDETEFWTRRKERVDSGTCNGLILADRVNPEPNQIRALPPDDLQTLGVHGHKGDGQLFEA